MSDRTEQDPETGRFLPGNSGFGGRPRGSRNKLGEAFLLALHDDFQTHGAMAIEQCRLSKPEQYVRVIASLLPQQLEIKEGSFDGITDEQLATIIAAARATLGIHQPSGEGTAETAH